MNTEQVTRFLNRLYEPSDRIEVAFIHPDGKALRRERSLQGESLPRLLDEMGRAETAGFNVYVSVLPLDHQERGIYDRVWVDQDDDAAPWPFGADSTWERPAWPAPNTLVRTSTGPGGPRWQAIWRLDSFLPEAEGRELNRRLADIAGSDTSVIDRRRVLRVPGILNQKRDEESALIMSNVGTINPEAFDLPTETAIDKLMSGNITAPQHILGEWLAGTPEGDRSRKAYVAARFLKSCEVEYHDAGAILKLGALRCDPPFDDRELEHVLSSAYHRGA